MSAMDTLAKLNGLDIQSLEPFQRVLLVTDGTLTEILEAMFFERIRLVKLSQAVVAAEACPALLEPAAGEHFMERKILLQGARSKRNYVYAESYIAVDRLGRSFRDELIDSGTPLGRLWLEHRLETFKELQEIRCLSADALCAYFLCDEAEPLLARTYRVFSSARPVMIITETFPAVYRHTGEPAEIHIPELTGSAQ